MDLFTILGEAFSPQPLSFLAMKVNRANQLMHTRGQGPRTQRTWVQWGLTETSTDREIEAIINQFVEEQA